MYKTQVVLPNDPKLVTDDDFGSLASLGVVLTNAEIEVMRRPAYPTNSLVQLITDRPLVY